MSNQAVAVERKRTGEPIVNVTSFTARQKASGYVGDRISHLMGGDEPTLMLTKQRPVWRVPIILTSPSRGCLGTVGALDVDARTGSLLIHPDFEEQVLAHAQTLAQPLLERRHGDA
ncbi:MAG: hypothetical protein JXA93_12310 [Anaerolineae bacterium]|nr:hypothetical protein [Anaerolineae bacterium]